MLLGSIMPPLQLAALGHSMISVLLDVKLGGRGKGRKERGGGVKCEV